VSELPKKYNTMNFAGSKTYVLGEEAKITQCTGGKQAHLFNLDMISYVTITMLFLHESGISTS
jgi:hypothetical protein